MNSCARQVDEISALQREVQSAKIRTQLAHKKTPTPQDHHMVLGVGLL